MNLLILVLPAFSTALMMLKSTSTGEGIDDCIVWILPELVLFWCHCCVAWPNL